MRVENIASYQFVVPSQPKALVNIDTTQGPAINSEGKGLNVSEGDTISKPELQTSIDKANKIFLGLDRRLEVSVHDVTNTIMVKVIDNSTDEIIREIPPKKILDMVAKIWEMAGLIVDEKI